MIFCLISGRLSNGNIAKMIACRYNVNCELSLYWWWWCISTSQWWQQASLSQVGRQGESHLVIGGERGTLGTLTYTARRWKWFGSWLVTLTQVTQDTQLSSHSQFITKLTSPDNCFPVALDSNLLEWHCHLSWSALLSSECQWYQWCDLTQSRRVERRQHPALWWW